MSEKQIGQERAGGLSGPAWAALGTVGAAIVAAVVTLVTVYVPAGGPVAGDPAVKPSSSGPSSQFSSTPVRTPASMVVPSTGPVVPRSLLLEQLTGRWQGQVEASGRTFTMTLDIPDTCAEGMPCGTMTTDLQGCVGDLVLVRIGDGPQFEFATVDFHEGSSSACELRPGGDYFTPGRDVLVWATGYDGSRNGRLRRVG